MKLKKYTLLIGIVLTTGLAFGQSPPIIEWQHSLGGLSIDYPGQILTVDDGYIIAGLTGSSDGDVSFNHGFNDAWVVKLDLSGNIVWEKTFGSTGLDAFQSIALTNDGNLIAAGCSGANDGDVTGFHGFLDFWVVKMTPDGNMIWQKSLGGSGSDEAYAVTSLSDGNYLVTGYTGSTDGNVNGLHGAYDYWVVKLDGDGNLLWGKCFGGTSTDWSYDVIESRDGNYVIAGYTTSKDGDVTECRGGSDQWIIKISPVGDLVWQKSVGKRGGDQAESIIETPAGGLVIAGQGSQSVVPNYNMMISRLKYDGTIKWAKYYGGSDQETARDMIMDDDRGFVALGNTNSPNDGDVSGKHETTDVWIMKVDMLGNLLWQKCLGGSQSDVGFGIDKTADGGYVGLGYSYSSDGDLTLNHGGQDIWVVKLSPEVERTNAPLTEQNTLLVYPNPGMDYVHFTYPERGYFTVTDLQGRMIAEGNFDGDESMNIGEWNTGIYYFTLTTDNHEMHTTFVKTE